MGFRRRAGGGRRDGNEGPIVEALRAVGGRVWFIGGTGNPDLLVEFQGQFTPLETKRPKSGKRTKNQADIPWPIVTTPEDALHAIGIKC
jgi:hypothetical protein